MSDILKLHIKSKSLKAIIPNDNMDNPLVAEYEEDSIAKEFEKRFTEGYEQGYQKAKEELEEATENELLKKTEEFYNVLSGFESTLKEYENDFLKIILSVSKAIAEKIVRKEVENFSILEETLRESASKIIGANEVIIKLNPFDYDYITKNNGASFMNNNFSRIKFENNSKIEKGGCFIETEIGNVDARISTQIGEITKALENKLLNDSKEK